MFKAVWGPAGFAKENFLRAQDRLWTVIEADRLKVNGNLGAESCYYQIT